ncbi:hypothetical protein THAOC_35050 [Thalassiosira oceanica]|uniref:Uncharacterized protein n=1 Tax=Thalassiosira oceanica TaxID=159749 RepID=K0R2H4_THAOC|nr:hypothetical protein THAOC_35050 [Thalassiosira oceanica]|eukprot:EJK46285.1 hypothetical protein THAOC_35050 [Thalassiosira oceanica]
MARQGATLHPPALPSQLNRFEEIHRQPAARTICRDTKQSDNVFVACKTHTNSKLTNMIGCYCKVAVYRHFVGTAKLIRRLVSLAIGSTWRAGRLLVAQRLGAILGIWWHNVIFILVVLECHITFSPPLIRITLSGGVGVA